MKDLVADLVAETQVVEAMLAGLPGDVWDLSTPAEGWAIRDQISHLAFFDEMTLLAMTDAERFADEAAAHIAGGMDFPDRIASEYRSMPAHDLHIWFRTARATLVAEFTGRQASERVPWYGPAMSLASCATARVMETWAHGQDIADTLAVQREPTARLRHIAHLGIRALPYAYTVRRREVPQRPIRVELVAPDGGLWTWGPEEAEDWVTGTALDFCLVVTQRRNLADTDLEVVGPVALEWVSIAQAFAGAAGRGRAPASDSNVLAMAARPATRS